MTAKDAINETIKMAQYITNEYLSDLSDADLLVRPVPSANHIAWQLGHLISSNAEMLAGVGGKAPELPAGFREAHGKETTGVDDAKKFGTKQQYLTLLTTLNDATTRSLDATPDAQLDKPAPEAMRSYAPTVGSVYNMIGSHVMMHVGQFATVRRKLGKPIKI